MNWYSKLLEIHEKTPIISIAVGNDPEYPWDEPVDVKQYSHINDVRILLDYNFDDGFGGTEGMPFTAWTEQRVYFPACYDGAEWIESVPRSPCDEATKHIGGG